MFLSKPIPQQNQSIYWPKNKLKWKIKGKLEKWEKFENLTDPALTTFERCYCDL